MEKGCDVRENAETLNCDFHLPCFPCSLPLAFCASSNPAPFRNQSSLWTVAPPILEWMVALSHIPFVASIILEK